MKTPPPTLHGAIIAVAGVLLVGGCTLAPSPGERQAQENVAKLGERLRPKSATVAQAALTAHSGLADYVRFAVLNHPRVAAAYFDWRATVVAIAPSRALPDPKLTFEADIADTLMSFMPGLMFDFMAAGKRAAMGRELLASSEVAYRTYVATVLRTAADARKAWIELAFVDESIRLRESSLGALRQSLELANIDYTTGRSMGTLTTQVRVTNDVAKLRSELASLADRRAAAHAQFKSALGLRPADPDPAWPTASLAVTQLPNENELWARVVAANADLAQMRAMVDMALASVEVNRTAQRPDFTVGAMADLKSNPLMVRPTATVSLPIWREKIAANIAAAEARRDANQARVNAEQLSMAAELARMLYMVREADRMIAYIDETALPNFERSLATIEAGYQSGMSSPAMIPETQLMALAMRIERVAALREREDAVTGLLLMTADITPAGAPLLPSPSAPSRS